VIGPARLRLHVQVTRLAMAAFGLARERLTYLSAKPPGRRSPAPFLNRPGRRQSPPLLVDLHAGSLDAH
jgi:hypothetical protein